MKILNLYSGLGGNRKLWKNNHSITAIEYDQQIADIYKDFYPNDTVIVCDAHKYLLEYYKEFDFIWGSPPCPTHSRMNKFRVEEREAKAQIQYPDMRLYQEIILLQNYFKGKWVIENVIPYYPPLIQPNKIIDRHYFWCNFFIEDIDIKSDFYMIKSTIGKLENKYGFYLSKYKINYKRKLLRNCVNPEIGKHILDCAMNIYPEQGELL